MPVLPSSSLCRPASPPRPPVQHAGRAAAAKRSEEREHIKSWRKKAPRQDTTCLEGPAASGAAVGCVRASGCARFHTNLLRYRAQPRPQQRIRGGKSATTFQLGRACRGPAGLMEASARSTSRRHGHSSSCRPPRAARVTRRGERVWWRFRPAILRPPAAAAAAEGARNLVHRRLPVAVAIERRGRAAAPQISRRRWRYPDLSRTEDQRMARPPPPCAWAPASFGLPAVATASPAPIPALERDSAASDCFDSSALRAASLSLSARPSAPASVRALPRA